MINRKLILEDFCGDVTDAIIDFPLFQYLQIRDLYDNIHCASRNRYTHAYNRGISSSHFSLIKSLLLVQSASVLPKNPAVFVPTTAKNRSCER